MFRIGVPALRTISRCFLPAAFGIITSSMFQAIGHGFMSLWGSLFRQLVGILPLAWILARVGGVTLVWASLPLAEIIGMTYLALAFRYIYKKDIAKLDDIK
jgi:Na+-driven multidrug efflux pump